MGEANPIRERLRNCDEVIGYIAGARPDARGALTIGKDQLLAIVQGWRGALVEIEELEARALKDGRSFRS